MVADLWENTRILGLMLAVALLLEVTAAVILIIHPSGADWRALAAAALVLGSMSTVLCIGLATVIRRRLEFINYRTGGEPLGRQGED